MENSARIRVNLSTREFEVEGSEQFVKEYYEKIETMLSALPSTPPPIATPIETGGTPPPGGSQYLGVPSTFGEYYHSFPTTITDVDKILIAGYFVEKQSADKSFTTTSAKNLLEEHSIKIRNPWDCVSKNKNAKRVFVVTKGKYRVSQTGVTHISGLLGK